MSDKKSFWSKYGKYVTLLFVALAGSFGLDFINYETEQRKADEARIVNTVKEDIPLYTYMVGAVFAYEQLDTIGGDGLPEYVIDNSKVLNFEMEVTAPGIPDENWLNKHYRPVVKYFDGWEYIEVYKVSKIRTVREARDGSDLKAKEPEDQ